MNLLLLYLLSFPGRLTNVVARWPGATHDSFMFSDSALGQHLEEDMLLLADGVLLGDSGYPCKSYLLTPFMHPAGRPQRRYQHDHTSTRSSVERTIGILKSHFRVLLDKVSFIYINQQCLSPQFYRSHKILENVKISGICYLTISVTPFK